MTCLLCRHVGLRRCELLLLVTAILTPTTANIGRGKNDKEVETLITGSAGTKGHLVAPPSYPGGNYSLDATSYVFVLDNLNVSGTVQLSIDDWDLHPLSWVTFRNSKYGGYIGRVLGRYDARTQPPGVISTPTCCLRVEFQTGCCAPPDKAFSGFSATYRFVNVRNGGRRTNCDGQNVFSQLCNGECILEIYTCPCPTYGEFKCSNGNCILANMECDGKDDCGDESDEHLCAYVSGQMDFEAQGSMYGFAVVISTVMAIVSTAFFLVNAIRCAEYVRARRRKNMMRAEQAAIISNCSTVGNVTWATPEPEVVRLAQTPPARVIPQGNFRCQTRAVAVLTTGHPPCVKVRPLVEHMRDNMDGDDISWSESGFHGEDGDGGMASSSSSAAALDSDLRGCHV